MVDGGGVCFLKGSRLDVSGVGFSKRRLETEASADELDLIGHVAIGHDAAGCAAGRFGAVESVALFRHVLFLLLHEVLVLALDELLVELVDLKLVLADLALVHVELRRKRLNMKSIIKYLGIFARQSRRNWRSFTFICFVLALSVC